MNRGDDYHGQSTEALGSPTLQEVELSTMMPHASEGVMMFGMIGAGKSSFANTLIG